MRVEELSVGDWVFHLAERQAGRILHIHRIGGIYSIGLDCADCVVVCGINDIAPIAITPEILEKNGCLHTAENRILCDWFDGRITVRKYNNREWYELFVGSNQMKFKLVFVHQLQHALRLAGIEKEIEV